MELWRKEELERAMRKPQSSGTGTVREPLVRARTLSPGVGGEERAQVPFGGGGGARLRPKSVPVEEGLGENRLGRVVTLAHVTHATKSYSPQSVTVEERRGPLQAQGGGEGGRESETEGGETEGGDDGGVPNLLLEEDFETTIKEAETLIRELREEALRGKQERYVLCMMM
jgi:hypothetical protein